MKNFTLSISLAVSALVLNTHAQSVESLGTIPAEDLAEVKNEQASAEEHAELITTASRYVGDDQKAYIQSLTSTFTIRGRDRDPFGRHQDPNYKPPAPPVRRIKTLKPQKVKITPFSDIVEAIPITTIIASKEQFLIGGRSFTTGNRLKLNVGKPELLTVHVVSVTPNKVSFRHGITNEIAEHRLQIFPGGMVPGGRGGQPAGVIPANGEAPIQISTPGANGSTLSSRR